MKKCSKCGKNERVVYSTGNIHEWCKECIKKKNHKVYLKNRDKIIKRSIEWSKNNKDKYLSNKRKSNLKLRKEVLRQYGGEHPKCQCCGEDKYEFLAIDHINGGGEKHKRQLGVSSIYGWLRKNNYPDGFRVLCHNCNSALGFYGYCPHNNL